MITWIAMVGSRDRPREGARGAQGTYRGDPEEGFRGDRPEGGVQRMTTGVVSRGRLQGRPSSPLFLDLKYSS